MSEQMEKLPEERLGEFLIRCREAKGLSREELSEDTHVAISYLEWMESGQWKNFPVEAYVRSYLNSVSVRLSLDPKKVLEWYSKESGSSYQNEFSAAPIDNESLALSQEKRKSKSTPIIVGVILSLILVALVYVMNLTKAETKEPVVESLPEEETVVEDSAETPLPILENAEKVSLDSLALQDSLAAVQARQVVDSVAKEKELPASATLFISSGSETKADTLTKEETKPKVESNIKTSIEFMASGNEMTWVGIKRQAEGETFIRQGNLSVAGSRLSYEGNDTLYVIIGNPTAIAYMTLNGKKVPLPTGSVGRSLRFRVLGENVFKGF
ncbi:MAG: helix-turn-helix domain-containing protein [Fibrobacteraceae bacterium]|jgi:cytoskeletal protein RodZ|nr:helix-turn-helix domain-containing protein [Fibrobacteraceae bacterium]